MRRCDEVHQASVVDRVGGVGVAGCRILIDRLIDSGSRIGGTLGRGRGRDSADVQVITVERVAGIAVVCGRILLDTAIIVGVGRAGRGAVRNGDRVDRNRTLVVDQVRRNAAAGAAAGGASKLVEL